VVVSATAFAVFVISGVIYVRDRNQTFDGQCFTAILGIGVHRRILDTWLGYVGSAPSLPFFIGIDIDIDEPSDDPDDGDQTAGDPENGDLIPETRSARAPFAIHESIHRNQILTAPGPATTERAANADAINGADTQA
jgi:hypothetical protein